MRLLIQRVTEASVTIEGSVKSQIGKGLMVLVGIEEADTQEDIDWLTGKLLRLRIFDDEAGVMNLDVQQVDGDIMVVSQFTLHAIEESTLMTDGQFILYNPRHILENSGVHGSMSICTRTWSKSSFI